MPIDTTRTGAAIAAHRQRMNLSQQGLAGLMNVTHQAVSKWEKGLALPDTETLLALAKLFDASMEELLMGVLPVAEAPEPPAEEAAQEEAEAANAEWTQLDFGSVMNMLPFVSTKVADQLFRHYYHHAQPDFGQLTAIAPFVSAPTLEACISEQPIADCSPEMLCSLAPFLTSKTVDRFILGMNGPIPPHLMQMLMPFASSKVVDQMVLNKLGMKVESRATSGANVTISDTGRQQMDAIHQRISDRLQKLNPESPRARIVRKAIERRDMSLLREMTGDLPELVSVMSPEDQKQVCLLLMENGMYNLLAEVIEERDDDILHALLDKAFELDDEELLHIISEHI